MSNDAELTEFLHSFWTLSEAASRMLPQGRSQQPKLVERLTEHLGVDPASIPVVQEPLPTLRVIDADVAIEAIVADSGGGELVGIGGGDQRWHTSLSEMLQSGFMEFVLGPVDYSSTVTGPDTERTVVRMGLHLFTFHGSRVAVMQRGLNRQYGAMPLLEVLCADSSVAAALLARVREEMTRLSVLRGQVVSFTASDFEPSIGEDQEAITFHRRPDVTAEQIVLPAGTLERIERHVIGIGQHRDALRQRGQHLKRGVLLYGPPGTGKTHTVRHLVGAATESTVLLLSGRSLSLVSLAAQTARALEPAIVVLEDCDLVAEERTPMGSSPLLFEVLDALDGLSADADVVFLLTTNRVDVLEPALAQRPGRVDLAVEIPRPDVAARRALLDLYAGGLGFSGQTLDAVARSSDGVTASFIKEVVRRAVLFAAENGHELRDDDLNSAVQEMMADSSAITRALVGGADEEAMGFYA